MYFEITDFERMEHCLRDYFYGNRKEDLSYISFDKSECVIDLSFDDLMAYLQMYKKNKYSFTKNDPLLDFSLFYGRKDEGGVSDFLDWIQQGKIELTGRRWAKESQNGDADLIRRYPKEIQWLPKFAYKDGEYDERNDFSTYDGWHNLRLFLQDDNSFYVEIAVYKDDWRHYHGSAKKPVEDCIFTFSVKDKFRKKFMMRFFKRKVISMLYEDFYKEYQKRMFQQHLAIFKDVVKESPFCSFREDGGVQHDIPSNELNVLERSSFYDMDSKIMEVIYDKRKIDPVEGDCIIDDYFGNVYPNLNVAVFTSDKDVKLYGGDIIQGTKTMEEIVSKADVIITQDVKKGIVVADSRIGKNDNPDKIQFNEVRKAIWG